MDLNEMKFGDVARLVSVISGTQENPGINDMVGKKVIIRTYSAGAWFGILTKKLGNEVILSGARRLWRFWCAQSISLSAVAIYGLNHEKSKVVAPVESVWLEAIEIIPCTADAISSIEAAPHAQAG